MADEIDALSKRELHLRLGHVVGSRLDRRGHLVEHVVHDRCPCLVRASAKLPRSKVRPPGLPEVTDPAALFDRLQRELDRMGLEIVRSQR